MTRKNIEIIKTLFKCVLKQFSLNYYVINVVADTECVWEAT